MKKTDQIVSICLCLIQHHFSKASANQYITPTLSEDTAISEESRAYSLQCVSSFIHLLTLAVKGKECKDVIALTSFWLQEYCLNHTDESQV